MTALVVIFVVLWLFVASLVLRQLFSAWCAREFANVVLCAMMGGILIFCLIAMVSVL